MAVVFNASVQTRYYFSSYHLWAATHFARLTVDQENLADPNFNIQHRAYVINAVLSAVAFLEGAINELFDDLADKHLPYVKPLSDKASRSLVDLWTNNKKLKGVGLPSKIS